MPLVYQCAQPNSHTNLEKSERKRHESSTYSIKLVMPLESFLSSLPHHPHLLAGIKPPSSSSRVSLSYHKWTNTDTSSQGTHQLSRVYVLVVIVGSYPRPGLAHRTPPYARSPEVVVFAFMFGFFLFLRTLLRPVPVSIQFHRRVCPIVSSYSCVSVVLCELGILLTV